ncbi:PepSY domain-containing protein [Sphingomonas donggukensis]|uniref:PepSY domain-containing protein n=1 Tax=Sphingomonas donggukensis TaxID=2949093 RepID=A0ABY4TR50_9SPHN|nr:PepSY domain-containing protein [Sphingomonas donggukensis]URW74861.1 PepSY domain-containing protein [Sphingomonas donggukensis]
MKLPRRIVALAAVIGMTVPALAAPAPIGMARARAIALKAAPGKVEKSEYEKEGGHWRYSFEIRQGARIHEIGVDAMSSRIVENVFEKPGAKD